MFAELEQCRSQFRGEFKSRWSTYIKKSSFGSSTVTKKMLAHLSEFVLRDAKRIRPFFLFLGRGIYSGKKIKKADLYEIWSIAIGIELVHSAMLIHDDIMDKSRLRRGKSTLHRIVGINNAIVMGDIAWSMGFDYMLSVDAHKNTKSAVKKFIKASIFTGEGQILDELLTTRRSFGKKELLEMYTLKTAHYTAAAPLAMGAILAGDKNNVPAFSKIGLELGRLFQLQDDILDAKNEKKSFLRKIDINYDKEKSHMRRNINSTIQKSTIAPQTADLIIEMTNHLYDRTA